MVFNIFLLQIYAQLRQIWWKENTRISESLLLIFTWSLTIVAAIIQRIHHTSCVLTYSKLCLWNGWKQFRQRPTSRHFLPSPGLRPLHYFWVWQCSTDLTNRQLELGDKRCLVFLVSIFSWEIIILYASVLVCIFLVWCLMRKIMTEWASCSAVESSMACQSILVAFARLFFGESLYLYRCNMSSA